MTWGFRAAVVAWGVFGVAGLLIQAIVRLTPIALDPIRTGMSWWQWCIYGAWVVVNAHAEGHRGFQRRFSPRVVARAHHLADHPRPFHVLLAPLYCMSLFHSHRRGLLVAWGILMGVVLLVVGVRHLPQPWRGIVDGGVVVGLFWGLVSLLVELARSVVRSGTDVDPELPPVRAARSRPRAG